MAHGHIYIFPDAKARVFLTYSTALGHRKLAPKCISSSLKRAERQDRAERADPADPPDPPDPAERAELALDPPNLALILTPRLSSNLRKDAINRALPARPDFWVFFLRGGSKYFIMFQKETFYFLKTYSLDVCVLKTHNLDFCALET